MGRASGQASGQAGWASTASPSSTDVVFKHRREKRREGRRREASKFVSLAGNLAKSLAGIAACVVVRAHETHERLGGGGGVSERTGYEMRLARIAVEWTGGRTEDGCATGRGVGRSFRSVARNWYLQQ